MSQEDFVITFPVPMPGFPELTNFRLFEPPGSYPLKFLQAVEDPSVSFACMDAASVKMDYEVPLTPEEAAFLALEVPEDALVLTLVVVPPDDPRKMTANLAGPVVINTRSRQGRQIQLDANVFPLKFDVFATRAEDVVTFAGGLVGFPALTQFRLMEPEGGYPLKFLQAVDQEDVSFVCIDVAAIKPEYEVPLDEEDALGLALEDPAHALVLALVVIPKDPRQMTANLAGPLVVNTKTLQGRQIILNPDKFALKYPVFAGR
jgi:flagellar assembly factor FliW